MDQEIIMDNLPAWLSQRPYWQQYLWSIYGQQDTASEAELDTAFHYLQQEHGLIEITSEMPIITFAEPPRAVETQKLVISKIKDISKVNAIPDGQSLELHPNLTVIYGENGTGKSGLARLLSNACFSRGNREILPNVNNPDWKNSDPASATFVMSKPDGTSSVEIKYTHSRDRVQENTELKRFSVFDSKSVTIHLDNSNSMQFRPASLRVFDKVLEGMISLERKLNPHIEEKRRRLNPLEGKFSGQSIISDAISAIDYRTTPEVIHSLGDYTEADESKRKSLIEQIEQKKKLNISEKRKSLQQEIVDLTSLIQTLSQIAKAYTIEKVKNLNEYIQAYLEKTQLLKEMGVSQFSTELFNLIGSEEWKSLIKAAQVLYKAERNATDRAEITHCLLCRQELSSKENQLFEAYWEFLQSKLEDEKREHLGKIENARTWFSQNLSVYPVFDETMPGYRVVANDNLEQFNGLKSKFLSTKQEFERWLDCLTKKEIISDSEIISIGLESIEALVEKKRFTLQNLVDPTPEIAEMEKDQSLLIHKKLVSENKELLLAYVEDLKWIDNAKRVNFNSRSYTIKQKELYDRMVTKQYEVVFKKVCQELNGDFGVTLKTKGNYGATLKDLILVNGSGQKLSAVLSEGEQKVCSLADFLTDVLLHRDNCGIIFDDPVTSLDHSRKERIAECLVKKACDKQVIIFTHDIVFLFSLKYYAKQQLTSDPIILNIRRVGSKPGIINSSLPWIAQRVKERKGYLKNELVRIKKVHAQGDYDVYRKEVKVWYELLREAWERSVEERLFKGVIERFEPSIKTQQLKNVVINSDLINTINQGMTESSNWIHDTAPNRNTAPPDPEKLEKSLLDFEKFITQCPA